MKNSPPKNLTCLLVFGLLAALCLGVPVPSTSLGAAAPTMCAHFIDVGQADATLLEFPCGAVLIDAGAQDTQHEDELVDYLDDFFQEHPQYAATLESIIITHAHLDHTSALKKVCQAFTVKRYVDPGRTSGKGTKNPNWLRSVAATKGIVIRKVTNDDITSLTAKKGLTDDVIDPIDCNECDPNIVIVWGRMTERPAEWTKKDFNNANNDSLVVRVDFGKASFLFTGDLETPAIRQMLGYYRSVSPQPAAQASNLLDADVCHVGHHGSTNATNSDLLLAVTPRHAVISVGKWNWGKSGADHFTTWYYGHPRRCTLELLSLAVADTRSAPIPIKVADAPKSFDDYILRRSIYETPADGTIRIRATLDGRFTVTTNN